MSAIRSASSTTAIDDVVEIDVAPLDEVLESARTGDEDVDGLAERTQLGTVARTAVDGGDCEACGPWREERARRKPERPAPGSARGPGLGAGGPWSASRRRAPPRVAMREGERLARACRCAAGDVASGKRVGKRRFLDREGGGDPVTLEERDEIGGHAEIGEGGGHRRLQSARKKGQPEQRLEALPATAGSRSVDRTSEVYQPARSPARDRERTVRQTVDQARGSQRPVPSAWATSPRFDPPTNPEDARDA